MYQIGLVGKGQVLICVRLLDLGAHYKLTVCKLLIVYVEF